MLVEVALDVDRLGDELVDRLETSAGASGAGGIPSSSACSTSASATSASATSALGMPLDLSLGSASTLSLSELSELGVGHHQDVKDGGAGGGGGIDGSVLARQSRQQLRRPGGFVGLDSLSNLGRLHLVRRLLGTSSGSATGSSASSASATSVSTPRLADPRARELFGIGASARLISSSNGSNSASNDSTASNDSSLDARPRPRLVGRQLVGSLKPHSAGSSTCT